MIRKAEFKDVNKWIVSIIFIVLVIIAFTIMKTTEITRGTFRMVASVGLNASGEAHIVPADYIFVEEVAPVRLKGYVED